MNINIKITNEEIINQDISRIKNQIEEIIEDTPLLPQFENGLQFVFEESFSDLIEKLSTPNYKNWFKILDQEFPFIPYLLSDKHERKTLTIYLMGILDFEINNKNIVFDKIESHRFFQKKKTEIKTFCSSSGIKYEKAIERLKKMLNISNIEIGQSKTQKIIEKTSQDIKISETTKLQPMFDRFGNIAVLKKQKGIVKIFIIVDDNFSKIEVKNINFQQENDTTAYFTVTTKYDNEVYNDKVILLNKDLTKISKSLTTHNGLLIEYIKKEQEFYKTILPEQKQEVEKPQKKVIKPKKTIEKTEVEKLREENLKLKTEMEKLKNTLDAYEEELMRKRSFFGWIRNFFK